MDIKQKTCVITGAASGIGRALAQELARKECHIALVDRDEKGLNKTLQSLLQSRAKKSIHIVDLADREKTKSLINEVLQIHPKIDILINNAGIALGGSFQEVSEEDFDYLMRINFQAAVDLTRSFLPILIQNQNPAKIVNISSLYGIIAPPGQTAYSASKFALRGFSHALSNELQKTNVDVLVVHPGGVATSIAQNAIVPHGVDPERVAREKKIMERLLKLPPEKAAQSIISAMIKDKTKLIVGSDAKLVSLIEKLFPVRYWSLIARLIEKTKN